MKRLCLALLLGVPIRAQWTVFDPSNLNQAVQTYRQVQMYVQLGKDMAAFVHNPAQFLAQLATIEQVALSTAATAGVTTSQRAAQLQELLRLQQRAMQEAQRISSISQGNMGAIGQWAMSLQDTSQELAAVNAQLKHEQRVAYYQERSTYQPQAQIISNWRLK